MKEVSKPGERTGLGVVISIVLLLMAISYGIAYYFSGLLDLLGLAGKS